MARMASSALLKQLREFATCDISDALLKLGVSSGGHIPDLHCYSPTSPASPSFKLFGPAYPVQLVAGSSTAPKPAQHFIDAAPLGSVYLINGPQDGKEYRNACWGGLMTLGAKNREGLGAVILGRVRDLKEHRDEDFPIFAQGHSTLGQQPFTRPTTLNEPISIPLPHLPSDPLVVHPGDLVMADEDGVVVIPLQHVSVEQVLEVAVARQKEDDLCAQDLRAGKGVGETYKSRRG